VQFCAEFRALDVPNAAGYVYSPWNGALEVAPNVRITADQAWRLGATGEPDHQQHAWQSK